MSRLEDLLKSLPPSIIKEEGIVWLTVTPDTKGHTWTVGYQGIRGGMVQDWFFDGDTPLEALEKLAELIESYRVAERLLR